MCVVTLRGTGLLGLIQSLVLTFSISSLSLVRHSFVFYKRVGVGVADGVSLIRGGGELIP